MDLSWFTEATLMSDMAAVLFVLFPAFPLVLAVLLSGGVENYSEELLWVIKLYISPTIDTAGHSILRGCILPIIIWIIDVFILAIVIGIITSLLYDWIKSHRRDQWLTQYAPMFNALFKPSLDVHTRFKVTPRYQSLAYIQTRLNITAEDIIDLVQHTPGLRLRNLASTYSVNEDPTDRLVVEKFPHFNRPYGIYIKRGSSITIVATSACRQVATGSFAYHIAAMGGFNYLAREADAPPGEYHGYYRDSDELQGGQFEEFKLFVNDLKDVINQEPGSGHKWVFFVMSTRRITSASFHFITAKEGGGSTVMQCCRPQFDAFVSDWEDELLNNRYQKRGDITFYNRLAVEVDQDFIAQPAKYLPVKLDGGERFNAVTMRVSWRITARDNRNTTLAFSLANQILRHMNGGTTIPQSEINQFQQQGITMP